MSNISLYQREELLEHMKKPYNRHKMDKPTQKIDMINRSCGDELTLYIKVKKGLISDISFDGEACGVAVASASMVTEYLKGKSIESLNELSKDFVLSNFKGSLTPSRTPCALLIYDGVKKVNITNEK